MANQYEDDEDETDNNEETQNAPANLRKALKKEQKEKADLMAQLATIQVQLRDRSVKDVLANKGVPEKIAKFIPGDVSTPEQVEAWLTENADVFGFSQAEPDEAPTEISANARAYQRINSATQNASAPTRDADLLQKVNGAKTRAELDALTGVMSNSRINRG